MTETVLAIDTSSRLCSLALRHEGLLSERVRDVGRSHAEVVLAEIDALLASADCRPLEIDSVVFTAGPGSFTGIRIAAAVAQGIAYAADAQVLPVPASMRLAWWAASQGFERVVSSIHSRGDLYYLAQFDGLHKRPFQVHGDELLSEPPRWLMGCGFAIAGAIPSWLGERRLGERRLGEVRVVEDETAPARSLLGVLADWYDMTADAQHPWPTLQRVAPEAALPIYVLGDTPWQPQS